MTAQIKKDNDTLTISVEGKIDTATSRELESIVNQEISNCTKLIFDFKELDYISSAGLRILLGAHKVMGNNGMKVINVNETVNEIFEVTGFSFILDIERI
jgi:anti-sigma B factor antagonist